MNAIATPSMTTHLQTIRVRNFRRFSNVTIDFDEQLTVLVAENGGGKTALLDAVNIALQVYAETMLGRGASGSQQNDVRLTQAPGGGMVAQTPATIEALARFEGQRTEWRRGLANERSRWSTTHAEALVERAQLKLRELREFADGKRETPAVLPVLAYYDVARLWAAAFASKPKPRKDSANQTSVYATSSAPLAGFAYFEQWFESVVREALNEKQTGLASPHSPGAVLSAVRSAIDVVLKPTHWHTLDWDFVTGQVVANHPEHGRLPVRALSDGVRNLLALVADLAQRAVRLNPHLGSDACLRAPGIVLIDEVDMHLHPSWQQRVIVLLREAFPAVQFIVTTHSALVISTVPRQSIRVLTSDGRVLKPDAETEGYDGVFALNTVFGVESTPPVEIASKLAELEELIERGESGSARAETLGQEVRSHFGEGHPALAALEGLKRLQALKAKRMGGGS